MTLRWLSTNDAAAYLGTSPAALRKRVELGEVAYHKVGRRLWFRVDDLDAYMNQDRHEAWA
jgi:excisionase family DNA binding protein